MIMQINNSDHFFRQSLYLEKGYGIGIWTIDNDNMNWDNNK